MSKEETLCVIDCGVKRFGYEIRRGTRADASNQDILYLEDFSFRVVDVVISQHEAVVVHIP